MLFCAFSKKNSLHEELKELPIHLSIPRRELSILIQGGYTEPDLGALIPVTHRNSEPLGFYLFYCILWNLASSCDMLHSNSIQPSQGLIGGGVPQIFWTRFTCVVLSLSCPRVQLCSLLNCLLQTMSQCSVILYLFLLPTVHLSTYEGE